MSYPVILVALSTMFFSSIISADSLTKVTENSEANSYVRVDSVVKKDNMVEFWQVTDFKQERINQKGESYLSLEHKVVINCTRSSQTMTFMKVYSRSMATGVLIANGSMRQRNQIPPGSALEIIKNFVCQ